MEKGSVRERIFKTRERGSVAVETHVGMRAGDSLARAAAERWNGST